jgi:sugar phosphate permease
LPPIEQHQGEPPPPASRPEERPAFRAWTEEVLFNWRLWGLAVTAMLVYMIRNGVANWGVTYLNEVKRLPVAEAGLTSSLFEWMGLPGALAAGFLADRFCAGRSIAVAPVFLLGAAGAVLGILYVPPGHGWLDVVGFGLCGFCVYGAQMLCTGLAVMDILPSRSVAAGVGITGALSYGGSVITSTLSAFLADRFGWHATFHYWAACGVCAFVLVLPLALAPRRARAE